MFSTSKSNSLNQNASDGGWLTTGGIAPLTINRSNGPGTQMLILIGVAALAALAGLWLILRK